ncbi:hypothetical protein [Streptomyces sp. DSM 40750]|uniref:hypothetical protein n=1 Tax=Streptomyces sp. DSM 40750 TaxID=2801030 RepID=UPI00214B6BEE|nr:hypothetical protein [Streptomyces sp. DSM 40750]UUU23715.1 hypothetical protein JIX55_27555 [Streptomyces sp. DSM 40750]
MRSARMLMATAAASAVLALGAPVAYAVENDGDHTAPSHSKEHDKGQDTGKEHGKETGYGKEKEHGKETGYGKEKEHGKEHGHGKPHGGVHTGGGALTTVTEDEWSKQDSGTSKDSTKGENSWSGKQEESAGGEKHDENSWSGKHEKPSGGVHTGGGALASPAVTAGGLAVLAVAASGLYAARRRKSAGSVV